MAHPFTCNHCGKSFELETPEAKECPFCFWSSSVKRDDEAAAERKQAAGPALKKNSPSSSGTDTKLIFSGAVLLFKGLFFITLLVGVAFLGYQLYSKWVVASKKTDPAISISAKDVKQSSAVQKNAEAVVAALSPEEKEILYRELTLPENPEPGEAEKQILEGAVEFKTGWSEKLSSPIWTLAQYQQMITEQEKFYKMPFARSYRKKLEELFTEKYLPAGDAFAKGDLLQARNLWVESLAFPPYSKDLMKHRAVALTMLRPFINDTLAKIGTLNQNLVIKKKRMKEEAVAADYQKLAGLIAQKQWAEAVQAIDQLVPLLDQLDAVSKEQVPPPPYPSAIAMVDQDIQRPLADLLVPNPVTMAGFLDLRQDLAKKRDVLTGLTVENAKAALVNYRNGCTVLRQKNWREAMNVFNAIQSPEVLRNDAQAKVAILQKVVQALDVSESRG